MGLKAPSVFTFPAIFLNYDSLSFRRARLPELAASPAAGLGRLYVATTLVANEQVSLGAI